MRKFTEQVYTDFLGDEVELTVDFFDLGEDGLELSRVRVTDWRVENYIDITPMIKFFGGKIIKLLEEARDADR
ncbi:hypothetical protein IOC51_06610 [Vibrio parahaemolyticus]|uniref:hypothetical protein n=1 Tax=Vibrio parahaemolyticus TaxID=670 RepID=UPI001E2C3BCD|nr:hypothetical protein [Vibrio parahaemolyticus]MCD1413706.1 hypothetical protein [Vibrio parahaemolyticus]